MAMATSDDIIRLFPGIQDHAVLEILASGASVDELEAAQLMLQDDDAGLQDFQRERGDRLNRLMEILAASGMWTGDDRDS